MKFNSDNNEEDLNIKGVVTKNINKTGYAKMAKLINMPEKINSALNEEKG